MIAIVYWFIKKVLLAAYTISHIEFLLKVERGGTPMTLNHYLNDNLQKCRQERFKKALAPKSLSNCSHREIIRISDLSYYDNISNAEHTVQDLHDIL
ncbi:hypothetical protein N7516_002864 [Penicillium verrucosum]|uniref:uncharacterized protein n=1 Tax=Penicillium verrucosum TaxID=60171 RepID=UPI0025450047|nr:uncharacterized protein N7516_002864 [Penicillium verrucosum]KAJ5942696.1 hypothetical protein N7516_002864 [Penicillium verrucosum]